MRYRAFGTTGLEVSEIVFGGGAVGGLLIDQDDDTRRRAIRRALDTGINWMDIAPSSGLAELRHLEEALAAAEMGPLDERALNGIESIYI